MLIMQTSEYIAKFPSVHLTIQAQSFQGVFRAFSIKRLVAFLFIAYNFFDCTENFIQFTLRQIPHAFPPNCRRTRNKKHRSTLGAFPIWQELPHLGHSKPHETKLRYWLGCYTLLVILIKSIANYRKGFKGSNLPIARPSIGTNRPLLCRT